MEQHSIYFLSYAGMATLGGIISAWAMYGRQKNEGIAINFNVLKAIFGFAFAMWLGVAYSNLAYNVTPTNAAIVAFFMGTAFSIFMVWQIKMVIQKLNADAKTIKELSTSCSLTELWNRRVFQERLSLEFARSKRHKHPLSVLLLDVECLGEVNSKYGYVIGDKVLLNLAKLLVNSTRNVDMVCRYGSNLITIVLPDTQLNAAETFASRLKEKIAANPFEVTDAEPLFITVSIGVSGFSENIETDGIMMDVAHDALRAARKIGRNQVVALAREGAAVEHDQAQSERLTPALAVAS
ncbi:MAG: GGDEF domain-containing protein [Rhodospirillales bacterium]|nr:GGDEF domain-containing protein [Rhodospirillales bacterium]